MSKLVTLTIDDKEVQVPAGTLIVDAAKKAGIDIPVFCYHPKMEPVGMCRMCLVDIGRPLIDRATGEKVLDVDGSPKIQFGPKLDTACTTPVSEGMVVVGVSEKVQAARNEIVEFILTSHPLDCPICDKGGECPLQNLTMNFGPGQSRFLYDEKMHLSKHVPLGELIYLDRERCIQCARCVRFQDEVVDDPVIGFYHRGRSLEIVTHSDPGFDSYFSGNTTDICPVGALTTADFRFGARPWELRATASVCSQCPVGCNLIYNVRREARSGGDIVIKRVMPRQNESVNEIWMCDKGRFTYHFTENEERLTAPLVRRNGELVQASWDEALKVVIDGFSQGSADLLALGSGRLSNEDLFNLRKLAEGAGGKAGMYTHMAGGDLVAQVGVGQGTNFSDMGAGTAILVVASDLEEEAPIWWLRVKQAAERGAALIVANPRPSKLERYAKYVLRYPYGSEAATVLALVNALSPKRPDLPGDAPHGAEVKAAAQALQDAENAVVLYGSEGLGLDGSAALAQACANLLIGTNHIGKANNGLIGVWSRANEQGAWDMGLRPVRDLKDAFEAARVLYIVGADPVGDAPALAEAFQHASFKVVQELFLTETAKLADVVLPAQAYTEREGTFTSGERRVQRFYPAVPARSECKADFAITAQIAAGLGVELEARIAARVMVHIANELPDYAGVNYRSLAEVTEQWPMIGRGDLYYGGTTYENTQGLGIQLAPASQRGLSPALAWPQMVEGGAQQDGLWAVPVTRLYDRGWTVLPSDLLKDRIPQPHVVLNPTDAAQLNIRDGQGLQVEINGVQAFALARLDENLPVGIVCVPRSMGLPISGPVNIKVSAAEMMQA
jgi:NADH-quinone oxidoreductase subunit G